jgi:hypothetical protein
VTLVARVAELLRAHRVQHDGHDEQTAALKLGYVRRPDHPWLNQQRAPVVETEGALGEQVSGEDFTR